jgi:hypothetical protein
MRILTELSSGEEQGTGSAPPIPRMDNASPNTNATPTRDQIRNQIREQVRAAVRGEQQGGAAGTGQTAPAAKSPPPIPGVPAPPGNLTTSTGDNPFDPAVMSQIQQTAENVSYSFFLTIAVIVVGLPIARALGRRIASPHPPQPLPSEDLTPKLRQLQESVDAMALELERISENQRFTTKLLAERPAAPALAQAAMEPPRG